MVRQETLADANLETSCVFCKLPFLELYLIDKEVKPNLPQIKSP